VSPSRSSIACLNWQYVDSDHLGSRRSQRGHERHKWNRAGQRPASAPDGLVTDMVIFSHLRLVRARLTQWIAKAIAQAENGDRADDGRPDYIERGRERITSHRDQPSNNEWSKSTGDHDSDAIGQ
jgi:hypothetical protein